MDLGALHGLHIGVCRIERWYWIRCELGVDWEDMLGSATAVKPFITTFELDC